jgi:hypothetical protein
VIQFQNATLVGANRWQLTGLLRGQAGSDALMPAVWGAGAKFVLLGADDPVLNVSPSQRLMPQHLRSGPSAKPLNDPSYDYFVHGFAGNGLRPLTPCHLTLTRKNTDVHCQWVRRTRIGGDDWAAPEIPIGEESESYLVRVQRGTKVLREQITTQPSWVYSAADQAADNTQIGDTLSVAQIGAIYGVGPATITEVPV